MTYFLSIDADASAGASAPESASRRRTQSRSLLNHVNQPSVSQELELSSTQSSGFHKPVSFRPIAPALRGAPGTDCQGVSVDPPRCAREGWRARRACWRAATRRRRRRAGWASPRLFAWIPPRRTRRGAWTRRGTPRGGRSPRAGAWRASPISTCARLKNGWCPRTARKVRRKPSPEASSSSCEPNPTSRSLVALRGIVFGIVFANASACARAELTARPFPR
jgi:hypothetical protein